ncbi:anion permease [Enterobacter ludwigii]
MTGNKAAWNTFVWFATLVALADGLSSTGFISWLGKEGRSADELVSRRVLPPSYCCWRSTCCTTCLPAPPHTPRRCCQRC